jgi:hypothetical protein
MRDPIDDLDFSLELETERAFLRRAPDGDDGVVHVQCPVCRNDVAVVDHDVACPQRALDDSEVEAPARLAPSAQDDDASDGAIGVNPMDPRPIALPVRPILSGRAPRVSVAFSEAFASIGGAL